jgi:hypothetical protein
MNGPLKEVDTRDINPSNNADAGTVSVVDVVDVVGSEEKREVDFVVHIEEGEEIGERRTVRGGVRIAEVRGDGVGVILPLLLFEDQSTTWHLCVLGLFWKILSWLKVSL